MTGLRAHKILPVISLVLFGLGWVKGQQAAVLVGQVTDLATGRPIAGAEIKIQGETLHTKSDGNGWYHIRIPGSGQSVDSFGFVGNMLVWDTLQMMELQIWTLKGQLVFQGQMSGGAGMWALPNYSSGIYLVVISFRGHQHSMLAASLGGQLTIVQPSAPFLYSQSHIMDTIEVWGQGYNTRYVVRQRATGTQHIKLQPQAAKYLDYLPELFDSNDFALMAGTPSRSLLGQVSAIKLVYDFNKERMYYINSDKYDYHFDFCKEVLGYRSGLYAFNQTQYPQGRQRLYYLGDLNYYKGPERYVLQFVASNEFSCNEIADFIQALKKTSYFGDKLVFYSIKQEWDGCGKVAYIDTETLYAGQNYQGLNPGKAYGYLRVVQPYEMEDIYLGKRDIVVYNGMPNDIPVVAGLITTQMQAPLSHINILCHSRGTPNMTLRDALGNPTVMGKMGELVCLEVSNQDFSIRRASFAQADSFWAEHEPRGTDIPVVDLSVKGLVELDKSGYQDVAYMGSKAANFAELMKVRWDANPIPLPEMSFAIPFYYYHHHLERHGIDKAITRALQSEAFQNNPSFRGRRLAQLRDTILSVELDPALHQAVMDKIGHFVVFKQFRFRSSTNAEDLDGFSGAGLYTSATAKDRDGQKTVDWAIKSVWAGLWNWRAFEERTYYGIEHQLCMMGVLVHRAFPNEDANGVLVTTNLYNQNDGIIINSQYLDFSIVRPEPGLLHEQIMVYRYSINPLTRYTIEYLSFSNAPGLRWKTVLTKSEVTELMDYALAVKLHYYEQVLPRCYCSFEDFALDIEFKLDSEVRNRKVYLKQVRPYGQN